MSDQLSTGLDALDRRLDGGVPEGTVIALTGDPASPADRLLYELASPRRTLYLTATRSEEAIRDVLTRSSVDVGECVVQKIDSDSPLDHAYQSIQQVTEQATIIIDPVDALEHAGDTRLTEFLNTFRAHLTDIGSVGILYCLDGRAVSPQRDLTEYMVDGILSVTNDHHQEALETRLTVPKFRGKPPVRESIEFTLDQHMTVEEAVV